MLSRIISVQDEITELVHDRELKALVAAMKQEAKSKFSEILDTVQSKEFWWTAKCLVELSAPAMNLLRLYTAISRGQARFIMTCSKLETSGGNVSV